MKYVSFLIPFLFLILSLSLAIFTYISHDNILLFFNDLSLSLKDLYHFSFDLKKFYTATTHASAQKIGFWFSGIYGFLAFIFWIFRSPVTCFLSSLKHDTYSFFKDLFQTLVKYWNELSLFQKLLLVGIFLLGIGMRLIYANQPMRGDEGVVFYSFAQHPWYVIISAYNNVGNHIFHTLLMHFSWKMFGDNLWALRLPVILSGLALIPISYVIIRALSQKYISLLATSIIASSSALIEYSVNSRGYMIEVLLMVLLIGLVKYLAAHRNTFVTVLWVVLASLSFWTVPTTFYIYGGICLWFFGNRLRYDTFKNTTVSLIFINLFILVLCFILYTPIFLANSGIGHMTTMMSGQIQENLSYSYFIQELFGVWTRAWPELFQTLSLIGILSALWFSFLEWKPSSLLQKKEFLIFPCLLWALGTSLFIFNPATRLWLVFVWVFYISIIQGLWKLIPSRIAPFIFTLLTILWPCWTFFNEYTYQYVYKNSFDAFQEARKAAVYLKNNLKSDDLIYAVSPTMMPLKYELEKMNVKTFIPEIQINSTQISLKFLSLSNTSQKIIQTQRIWILRADSSESLDTILSKFDRDQKIFGHLTLVNQYENGALYLLTLKE